MVESLTIVVPVFNERDCVERSLRGLAEVVEKLRRDCLVQVVIVDDGSTDGSLDIVRAVAGTGDRVIVQPRNFGKTSAVRRGLEVATGQWFVVPDADLEYQSADLLRLVSAIRPGDKAIYGVRQGPWSRLSRWPMAMGVLSIDVLTWCLFGQFVRDHATCFKLIQTERLRRMNMKSNRFDGCVEITCQLLRSGCHIRQVSIGYSPRCQAEGKKLRWADGFHVVRRVICCRWAG